MNLTAHFSFDELTNTSNLDLLDANRSEANAYVGNLTNLCTYILEPLRNVLGKPITISSGFRGEALNHAVGGVTTSQHSFGEAADCIVNGMSAKELFDFVKENKDIFTDHLAQCILEEVGGKEWVHLSLKTDRFIEAKKIKWLEREKAEIGLTAILPTNESAMLDIIGVGGFLTTTDGKNYERVA
jgi:hypothetical protein